MATDTPSHYHAITRITAAWQEYVAAVRAVATQDPERRERENESEADREVHVTRRRHSQKGG